MSRNSSKWLPALIVPAVVATGIIALPMQAGAAVDLPDKSASEVLKLISDSTEQSFSGTVTKTADIGLPNLDGLAPQGEAGGVTALALEALTGTQEARVFVDGPENVRVQVTDRFAERNFVSNGTDVWFFDSDSNTASHLAIPADAEAQLRAKIAEREASAPSELSNPELSNPAVVAEKLLAEIDPTTDVTVGSDAKVAGRTVYELVLTPKASDTLVESVSIAVDSETGLPLQVTVMADGQDTPAFRVGFTSIDLSTPDAGLFSFAPAANVTVDEVQIPDASTVPEPVEGRTDEPTVPEPKSSVSELVEEPVITGTGWDAIVEIAAPAELASLMADPTVSELTTAVDGGRVLKTSLVTVLLTTDGRILAGSVPVERLLAAAAG